MTSHQNDVCDVPGPFHSELIPTEVEHLQMGVVDYGIAQKYGCLVLEVIVPQRHRRQVHVVLRNRTPVGRRIGQRNRHPKKEVHTFLIVLAKTSVFVI